MYLWELTQQKTGVPEVTAPKEWLIPTKVFNRITLRRVEAIEKLVNEGEEGLALGKLAELRNSLEARVKVAQMPKPVNGAKL